MNSRQATAIHQIGTRITQTFFMTHSTRPMWPNLATIIACHVNRLSENPIAWNGQVTRMIHLD